MVHVVKNILIEYYQNESHMLNMNV